jgi:hypothetical protein
LDKDLIDKKTLALKEDLEENKRTQKELDQQLKNDNYSSGVESDNDLDLLVE